MDGTITGERAGVDDAREPAWTTVSNPRRVRV